MEYSNSKILFIKFDDDKDDAKLKAIGGIFECNEILSNLLKSLNYFCASLRNGPAIISSKIGITMDGKNESQKKTS